MSATQATHCCPPYPPTSLSRTTAAHCRHYWFFPVIINGLYQPGGDVGNCDMPPCSYLFSVKTNGRGPEALKSKRFFLFHSEFKNVF